MKHYTFVDYATQGYMALVALVVLLFHNETVAHWPWLLAAHIAGLLLVHGLIQSCKTERPLPPLDFLRHFYPVFLYIWFFSETGWLNRLFFRDYLDALAIRADQALLGYQPSILFMNKLPYLAVSELFYAAYFSYYLMIFGIGIGLYLRERRQFFHYLAVISFVFYVCYALYIVLPVVGPRVFFHDVPGYQLPVALDALVPNAAYPSAVQSGPCFRVMAFIYRVFEAPGAAFPSSHVAIALCTVYFSFKYLPRIRYPHLVLAVLLCFATVYCRYHYVVDVLAGVATACLLVPIANRSYFRFANDPCEEGAPEHDTRKTRAVKAQDVSTRGL
jgi:membrane-associated phospholipid phosphatase